MGRETFSRGRMFPGRYDPLTFDGDDIIEEVCFSFPVDNNVELEEFLERLCVGFRQTASKWKKIVFPTLELFDGEHLQEMRAEGWREATQEELEFVVIKRAKAVTREEENAAVEEAGERAELRRLREKYPDQE